MMVMWKKWWWSCGRNNSRNNGDHVEEIMEIPWKKKNNRNNDDRNKMSMSPRNVWICSDALVRNFFYLNLCFVYMKNLKTFMDSESEDIGYIIGYLRIFPFFHALCQWETKLTKSCLKGNVFLHFKIQLSNYSSRT